MQRIAIQDANILIDLIKIGLLDHSLNLNFTFFTTDIIKEELNDEQVLALEKYVSLGELDIISISDFDLEHIQFLMADRVKLSLQDCSALYFAHKFSGLLLTGDKELRKAAIALHIEVRGIIWVLDQLVENRVITKADGVSYLKLLLSINKRVPIGECMKRINAWGEV